MEIGGNKITWFLSFLFDHHNGDFAEVFDEADKSGDLKRSVFPIEREGDLSIGRGKGREGPHFGSFPIDEEDRVGSKLRDHMVATLSAELSQGFGPIPSICQKIHFTRDREAETLKHFFNQGDFGLERATSFTAFGVIEFGPERQKKVLIEERKQDPLVAKDMGFSSPVFMPGATGHLLACLLSNSVIHNEKENRMGFDPQMVEELGQSDVCNFFHGPDISSQESGEA